MKRKALNILAWTVVCLSIPMAGLAIWDGLNQSQWEEDDRRWQEDDKRRHSEVMDAIKRECG